MCIKGGKIGKSKRQDAHLTLESLPGPGSYESVSWFDEYEKLK